MLEEKVRVKHEDYRCPFCHEDIVGGATHICAGCRAIYHLDCTLEAAKCASCDSIEGFSANIPVLEKKSQKNTLESKVELKFFERVKQYLAGLFEFTDKSLFKFNYESYITRKGETIYIKKQGFLEGPGDYKVRMKIQENYDKPLRSCGFLEGSGDYRVWINAQLQTDVSLRSCGFLEDPADYRYWIGNKLKQLKRKRS